MATTATVRVTRTGQEQSQGRPWEVALDGAAVDSIGRGETLELRVEPGHHALQVRAGGILASPERSFEAGDGQVVGFSCRTRPKHPFIVQRSLYLLIGSLFTRSSWIALTPDEGYLTEATEATGATSATSAGSAGSAGATIPPASVATAEPVAGAGAGAAADAATATVRSTLSRQPRPPLDPNGEPVLTVNRLTKRFGKRTAFSEVSFEVLKGEVFGFLGPNGAGKTTTVRTLGTMIAPTSGSATVAGIPLTPENGVEIRQRVSIMPEAPGLYLRLTVAENLEYFAGLYGLRHPEARIATALDAVNLGDRAGDLCGGLSKGLRQRVGLARTLLSDPAIMFLDEPTSGLDPVAAREVHDLVDGLRLRGVTIFLTTHRLDEAEKLCDRVAILNTTLRTIGRPADLRAQLFKDALIVETLAPLDDPGALFAALPGVESWKCAQAGGYELSVADPRVAAPEVTRRLVGAGADVLSIREAQHSLEDVYLELINEDVEARRP
jgi:ABC-2 type transport system ATP-binding protein